MTYNYRLKKVIERLRVELEEEFHKRKLAEKLLEIREITLKAAHEGQNGLRLQYNRLKEERSELLEVLEAVNKRARECQFCGMGGMYQAGMHSADCVLAVVLKKARKG